MARFETLSAEIKQLIITQCPKTDILRLIRTCRYLNDFIKGATEYWLRELEKEIGLIGKNRYPNRDWYCIYYTFRMGWSNSGSPRVIRSHHTYIDNLSTIPKFNTFWQGIQGHPYNIREGYFTDEYFSPY